MINDDAVYFGRLEVDCDKQLGSYNNYSKLDNMDHMDMDEQLISSKKQTFWTRNRRWLYLAVGLVVGCFVTVGISYLFFSLGKNQNIRGNSQTNGMQII